MTADNKPVQFKLTADQETILDWTAARFQELDRPKSPGDRSFNRHRALRHILAFYAALPESERRAAIIADTTS